MRGGWEEGQKNLCEINFEKLVAVYQNLVYHRQYSDWSNLTSAVNTTALLMQRRNAIWCLKVIVLRVMHALNLYHSKPRKISHMWRVYAKNKKNVLKTCFWEEMSSPFF